MWSARRTKQTTAKYASSNPVSWLIVGVGNPGKKYADTPHNAGFAVVERFSEVHGIGTIAKHQGVYGEGNVEGTRVATLLPMTFMNLSGQSVGPAIRAVEVPPDHLVVVHDEIDLPFGQIRIKFGGGLAGHNGLKSIAGSVKTQDFVRIRIGVGRPDPGDRRPVKDWILSKFPTDCDVEALYSAADSALIEIIRRGVTAAMNDVNTQQP